MISKSKLIILCLLSVFLVSFIPFDIHAGDTFTLSLLHTNDLHGRALEFYHEPWQQKAGGFPRIAAKVEEIRQENPSVLLLDAGDLFSGTMFCSVSSGGLMVLGATAAGYDAIAIGNHEFDYGQDILRHYIDNPTVDFDVPLDAIVRQSAIDPQTLFLSANILTENGDPFAPSHLILEVDDIRVLVIGLTTTTTRTSSHPKHTEGLRFRSPRLAVRGLLDSLDGSFDLLVVLSHLGLEEDLRLAETVPEVDVIIGGHSHRVLAEPFIVGETIVVQAGAWGLHLGQLDILLHQGEIQSFHWTLHAMDASIAQCSEVLSLLQSYAAGLQPKQSSEKILGFTSEPLMRNPSWFVGDSVLGNLFTDAMRWAVGADVAIYNNGGLRSDIPAGPITYEVLFLVEPFNSDIVLVELSGRQMEHVFQHMASRGGEQVSGARFQVLGGRASNIEIQGFPLDDDTTYTLAVSDFLAAGGSNYWMLPRSPQRQGGVTVRDAVARYLLHEPEQEFQSDGRILWREESVSRH